MQLCREWNQKIGSLLIYTHFYKAGRQGAPVEPNTSLYSLRQFRFILAAAKILFIDDSKWDWVTIEDFSSTKEQDKLDRSILSRRKFQLSTITREWDAKLIPSLFRRFSFSNLFLASCQYLVGKKGLLLSIGIPRNVCTAAGCQSHDRHRCTNLPRHIFFLLIIKKISFKIHVVGVTYAQSFYLHDSPESSRIYELRTNPRALTSECAASTNSRLCGRRFKGTTVPAAEERSTGTLTRNDPRWEKPAGTEHKCRLRSFSCSCGSPLSSTHNPTPARARFTNFSYIKRHETIVIRLDTFHDFSVFSR